MYKLECKTGSSRALSNLQSSTNKHASNLRFLTQIGFEIYWTLSRNTVTLGRYKYWPAFVCELISGSPTRQAFPNDRSSQSSRS